jgi:hypothetical protein
LVRCLPGSSAGLAVDCQGASLTHVRLIRQLSTRLFRQYSPANRRAAIKAARFVIFELLYFHNLFDQVFCMPLNFNDLRLSN